MKKQSTCKPIRYYEEMRLHWWGCPKCKTKYSVWESLWLHAKHEHNLVIGDYHEGPEDYELKRLPNNV